MKFEIGKNGERGISLAELVCAVLVVSITLCFGGVALAQMAVRVDNATKVVSEPTNSVFWASNAAGITNAIGTNYATAAQGALAATALQPGASWTNISGLGTAATNAASAFAPASGSTNYATAAQGVLAGTALQPGASWTNISGIGTAATNAASAFAPATGSTNIVTVGTITNGTWNGSNVTVSKGGTGGNSTMQGRNNLGLTTIDSGQRYTFAKVAQWSTTSVSPVRVLVWGDSLAGGLKEGPLMARQGQSADASSFGGSAAYVSGNNSIWVNGRYLSIPSGSNATFSPSGASDDFSCDRYDILYIKEPGAGNLTVDVSYNAGSSWSNLGNLTCSNNSTVGANATFTPSISWAKERSRLRLSAVGGPVKVIGVIPYNVDGPGVIYIANLFNGTGHDPDEEIVTPDAIVQPIYQAIAPDLVLQCFARSFAARFDEGGGIRVMYDKMKTWKASTDFVFIAPNPDRDYDNLRIDSAALLFNFAREKNESFFDGYSIFGSWALANAAGMYNDGTHLTALGDGMRNWTLWSALSIGRVPMGAAPIAGVPLIWTVGQNADKVLGFGANAGTLSTVMDYHYKTLRVTSASGDVGGGPFNALRIADISFPGDLSKDWGMGPVSSVYKIRAFGIDWMKITGIGNVGNGTGKIDFSHPVTAPGFRITSTTTATSLTADNQNVNPTDLSFIRLSSDSATATDRTFTLSNGIQGAVLILKWTHATNRGELASSGNCELSATWSPDDNDTLTLIWDSSESKWTEVARASNP